MNTMSDLIERKNNFFIIFTLALSVIVLFTYAQLSYNVVIHIVLLFLCMLATKEINKEITTLLISGVLSAMVIAFMARNRMDTTPIREIGFFLHYLTWPILLHLTVRENSDKYKTLILRFIFILCIIGNIMSLKTLMINSEASRILAGSSEYAKEYYYGLGVGGYGYVYAMVFLTYGAIVWLINNSTLFDKLLLIVFLITNYLFIVYASYTIAIIMTLALTITALTSKMHFSAANTILVIFIIFIVVFGEGLITLGRDIAEQLELDWVVKRFSQLLEANTTGDYSELRRSQLYLMSFESFLSHPFLGGNAVGGHSQILDSLARFGFLGILVPFNLYKYSVFSIKIAKHRNLIVFYLAFFVFAVIDTCSAMQIAIVVFYVCPLISNIYAKTNENGI